jgi:hypothetical protein
MSRKVWYFDVGGERHIVDLQYNWFTLSGKVTVDGKFVEGWSAGLRSKDVGFDVGGKPAILRFIVNPVSANKQELYVDGVLVEKSK